MINEKIVEIAKSYIGQKEVAGNNGFVDKKFNAEIEAMGFEKGQSWCSYFAELVYKMVYITDAKKQNFVNKMFSANAVRTFENFKKSGMVVILNEPIIGALAVWMSYSKGEPKEIAPGWYAGHIGIVSEITKNGFKSIEGNTNAEGGREGIEVAEKQRTISHNTNNGLRLIGFIKPM